jgi:hypothetical protein
MQAFGQFVSRLVDVAASPRCGVLRKKKKNEHAQNKKKKKNCFCFLRIKKKIIWIDKMTKRIRKSLEKKNGIIVDSDPVVSFDRKVGRSVWRGEVGRR